ncbi:hypothetical protein [Pseudomonas sp. ITEM 17296]|uniref:hypothetical protein n=1 Tax=Pseudomonas sp. ITEM 17296 TaxID=2790281 RepID=UPI0023801997|nr:hypothetical protein [Pseudomonas sp. ITEM 17296]
MSTQTAEYDQLQAEAAKTPAKLIQAMAERDGEDEGGLTLSREHIITLNRYVNFVFGLPSTPDNLQRWLGYTQIDEPELAPRRHDHAVRCVAWPCAQLGPAFRQQQEARQRTGVHGRVDQRCRGNHRR